MTLANNYRFHFGGHVRKILKKESAREREERERERKRGGERKIETTEASKRTFFSFTGDSGKNTI